jgi:quercetin dioxygenase-like cupin family protein
MKVKHLEDMTKGWFVGNFEPSLYKTNDCEVAVKSYKKGEAEKKHYHKIATEITVIVKGKVRMFDTIFSEGDIVVAEPGDATAFEALEDAVNVVVKLPGANDDKYEVEE